MANDVIPDSYKYGYGVNKKKVNSNFFNGSFFNICSNKTDVL